MNILKVIVLSALVVSTAQTTTPVQAGVRNAAATALEYARKAFDVLVSNPITWGYRTTISGTHVGSALFAGAIAAYLANKAYKNAQEGDAEPEAIEAITDGSVWTAAAGLGAGTGAALATFVGKSTSHGAIIGGVSALGALLAAEAYRKFRGKSSSATRQISNTKLPFRFNEFETVGNVGELVTLLEIGMASGLFTSWLFFGSGNYTRSAVAGVLGGLLGKAAFDLNWVQDARTYIKDRL